MPDLIHVTVLLQPAPFRLEPRVDDEDLPGWGKDVWALPAQQVSAEWTRLQIVQVCEAVLAHRLEALDQGAHRLAHLTQQQLAEAEHLSAADVSRVVRHVRLDLPDGMVDPGGLFSAEVGTTGLSSLQIQLLVLALCLEQPAASDQALTSALEEVGVGFARRTVAKFREGMGLPSGGARKSWSEAERVAALQHALETFPGTERTMTVTRDWLTAPASLAQRVAACRQPVTPNRPSHLPDLAEAFARASADELVPGGWAGLPDEERAQATEQLVGVVRRLFGRGAPA